MAANSPMVCPQCGAEMNHHCDKLVYATGTSEPASADGGAIVEFHTCPECGGGASRQS
jgi:ribosomal protein S27AE